MRFCLVGVVLCSALSVAWAQAPVAFPTEFPEGAVVMEPAALVQRLTGAVIHVKYADGTEARVEYKDTYAFLNAGNRTDSGKWRVQNSQICVDWQRSRAGCVEVRTVGDALYAKRAINGEIVRVMFKP
jgi:hypothetical protein